MSSDGGRQTGRQLINPAHLSKGLGKGYRQRAAEGQVEWKPVRQRRGKSCSVISTLASHDHDDVRHTSYGTLRGPKHRLRRLLGHGFTTSIET